jgi:predicted alpha/beta hydrolase family esterase
MGWKKMKGKRVFLVHGWGDNPEVNWLPWIKKELERKGFKVTAPFMPDTDYPKISAWVKTLKDAVGVLDKDTYFIGHSMGCQTIMRAIESLPGKDVCGGVVFVAGWIKILEMPSLSAEELKIVEPWTRGDVDFNGVKRRIGASVAIFSDNDPFIPLSQEKLFKEKLGAKTIIEHNKGHFRKEDGVTELPVVLQEFLKVSK